MYYLRKQKQRNVGRYRKHNAKIKILMLSFSMIFSFLTFRVKRGFCQCIACKCLNPLWLQHILLWCMHILVIIFRVNKINRQNQLIFFFHYLKLTSISEETSPVNERYVQESIQRSLALFFTIVTIGLLLFICMRTTCIPLISGFSWTAVCLASRSFKQNNDSLLRSSITWESPINSNPCCRNFGKSWRNWDATE